MKRSVLVALAVVVIIVVVAAVYLYQRPPGEGAGVLPSEIRELVGDAPESLGVVVEAFPEGEFIPKAYTCDGADRSPAIRVSNVPEDAVSLMIIMYDPDAPGGVFYHWALYNIPPSLREIPEGLPKAPATDYGLQALNDFGRMGYSGPCPPGGHGAHRYVFIVLALDEMLLTPPQITIRQLISVAKGHVTAYGMYMGRYAR